MEPPMGLLSPGHHRQHPQPSNGVWPGLHDASAGPVHARIARGLTRAAVRSLPVTLRFPDGLGWGAGGPRLDLVRPDAFFTRLGRDGLIGFGEAWMVGDLTAGGWTVGSSLSGAEVNRAT